MRRSFAVAVAVTVALFLSTSAGLWSAEPAVLYSGPQVGEKLPALKIGLAYGPDSGQVVDLVELARQRPSLIVIVNGSNRPAAGLTRSLMNFSEMYSDQYFAGVVYLDADRPAAEKYLRAAPNWWSVAAPIGVSIDGAEGPGSYGLNRNVNVTVLVADQGRVTANHPLIQPSLTDIPKILADVNKLTPIRVPSKEEVTFLSMPTAKLDDQKRRNAPTDLQMRKLFCEFLAADTDARVQAATQALEEYVGEDIGRLQDLGGAVSSMSQVRQLTELTDHPGKAQLEKWRDRFPANTSKRMMTR